MVGAPFARLLANIVVMGTGVLGRAFVEAYKQALTNGGKAATTAAKAAPVARGGIAEAEARMILNVKPKATEEEVAAAAESLLKMNDTEKGGSEYLQYKIRNARDSIVVPPPEPEPPKQEPPKKDDSSA